LAHAIGKDENVILIAQNMDDIPFDLRHRCIIIYSKDKLDRFAIVLSKTIDELKWKPIEIEQWISTDEGNLRVGLSFPRDKSIVHKTPIEAAGRVVGLSENDLKFWIQGFVITDREYQQGASMIDKNGFWKINAIHLGAVTHRLFFRIYDESGRCIANSEEITIEKRNF